MADVVTLSGEIVEFVDESDRSPGAGGEESDLDRLDGVDAVVEEPPRHHDPGRWFEADELSLDANPECLGLDA